MSFRWSNPMPYIATFAGLSAQEDCKQYPVRWWIDGVMRSTDCFWNWGPLSVGKHTVKFAIVNSGGVVRASITKQIRIRGELPLPSTLDFRWTSHKPFQAEFAGMRGVDHCKRYQVEWFIDGDYETTQCFFTKKFASAGPHTVTFKVMDGTYAKVRASVTKTIQVKAPKSDAPSVSEDEIPTVERYAPTVVFHPDEHAFPMSPDVFLKRSSLKWAAPGCPDPTVSRKVSAWRLSAGQYAARAMQRVPFGLYPGEYVCQANGQSYASNEFTAPAQSKNAHHAPPKWQGFFTDLADSYRMGLPGGSSGSFRGPPMYYSWKPHQWIIYWLFFGYNDRSGDRHEGDWERFVVRLDDHNRAVEVAYHAHFCDYMEWQWGGVPKEGGTHPLVWVAQGGHGTWPGAGPDMQVDGCVPFKGLPDVTGDGMRWRTWANPATGRPWTHPQRALVNAVNAKWYGYGGGWGERANIHVPSGSWGPAGPSQSLFAYTHPSPFSGGLATRAFNLPGDVDEPPCAHPETDPCDGSEPGGAGSGGNGTDTASPGTTDPTNTSGATSPAAAGPGTGTTGAGTDTTDPGTASTGAPGTGTTDPGTTSTGTTDPGTSTGTTDPGAIGTIGLPVAYVEGDLVQGSGTTVWYLQNGYKRGVSGLAVITELGKTTANIRRVTDLDLGLIPTGGNYYPTGTFLRGSSSATVWYIDHGVRHALSRDAYLRLSGNDWSKVKVVDDSVIPPIPPGESILA